MSRKPNNSGVEVGMNQTFPSVGKTQLPTPTVNSSFPAIKPLPGTKKNFPEVTARVNLQPMTFRKPPLPNPPSPSPKHPASD